jgi:hypothetical protein
MRVLGNTVRLTLNTTDAVDTNAGYWNNTTPTSTVFTVGSNYNQATPYDYVAYCFAEVEGFSKFGSYTGNGVQMALSCTRDLGLRSYYTKTLMLQITGL